MFTHNRPEAPHLDVCLSTEGARDDNDVAEAAGLGKYPALSLQYKEASASPGEAWFRVTGPEDDIAKWWGEQLI